LTIKLIGKRSVLRTLLGKLKKEMKNFEGKEISKTLAKEGFNNKRLII